MLYMIYMHSIKSDAVVEGESPYKPIKSINRASMLKSPDIQRTIQQGIEGKLKVNAVQ